MLQKSVIILGSDKAKNGILYHHLQNTFSNHGVYVDIMMQPEEGFSVDTLGKAVDIAVGSSGRGNVVCVGMKSASVKEVKSDILIDYSTSLLRDGAGKVIELDGDHDVRNHVIKVLVPLAGTREQVTISGKSVTGKSTITKGINGILGYKHLSAGNDVARPMAEEYGMLLEPFIKRMDTDHDLRDLFDKRIDDWNKEMLKNGARICLESRLGGLWADEMVFRVLMQVDDKTAGERLYYECLHYPEKRKQLSYPTPEAARDGIIARNKSDRAEYLKKYDFDFTDPKHYDFVMNNAAISLEQMVPTFLNAYEKFLIAKINAA